MADYHGPLCVLAGALCFSTIGFTQAICLTDGATPLLTCATRVIVGGLALLAWCALTGKLPRRGDWPLLNLAVSALAILGFLLFFLWGTLLAGVAIGTLVAIGSTPLAAAALAAVFLGEHPVPAWYPATALAVVGMILLNWTGEEVRLTRVLIPALAGCCYGLYMTFSRRLTRSNPPEAVMAVIFLVDSVLLLPFLEYGSMGWLLSTKGLFYTLNLGLVTAALGFTLTQRGLMTTPASTAGTLALGEPLGAMALGFAALGEPISRAGLMGVACVLAGALLLILKSASAGTRRADQGS